MIKKICYILIFLFVFLFLYLNSTSNYDKKESNSNNSNSIVGDNIISNDYVDESNYGDTSNAVNPSLYVATDALGRTVVTNQKKSTSHYRAVGMFYWTWHLQHRKNSKPLNINNTAKLHPDKINDYEFWSKNYKGSPWWNEPIYGYYLENDDYVLRKQAEMLADAGVDFVVFDCTNGTKLFTEAYENLLKVWLEAKNQGIKVPRVAFMLSFWSDWSEKTSVTFMELYNNLYNPSSSNYKKYSSLLFTFNTKPLILMNTYGVSDEVKSHLSEFEVRVVEASYFSTGAKSNGNWGWLSTYPQAWYKKGNGDPEQISVGIAQNANYQTNTLSAMNGTNIMGRSYASGNYSYSYKYKNQNIVVGSSISGATAKSKNTSFYGRNFQQQWDYAISIDPEIVFVTGWNEWIMGRNKDLFGVKNAFCDEFNDEYSRDIEPSKGDLKDYYYYQLVSNVRKYKGVSSQPAQTNAITIKNTSDWNNSSIINYNHYTGGKLRDAYGAGHTEDTHYVNKTFRNDIKKAKVSYDSSYIYFYVETVKKLTSYDSDKWMRLLIDTKNSTTSKDTDNWEEFEYIVNRNKGTSTTLTLEKSKGGWNFTKVGDVTYKVTNNILEIKIPRAYLNLKSDKISFNFKWCDNNLDKGDIMTLYTDGDSAPGGRFAFHFEGSAAYKEVVKVTSKKGDVNSDNKVNTIDYLLVKKHILKTSLLTGEKLKKADVNSDGKITSLDYISIKKIILGI